MIFQIQISFVIIALNIGFSKFHPFIIKMDRQWGKKGEGFYNISIFNINNTQVNKTELNSIKNKKHDKLTLYDFYNNRTNFVKANITGLEAFNTKSQKINKIITKTEDNVISTRNNFLLIFSSLITNLKSIHKEKYGYYGNRTGLFYINNLSDKKLLKKNKNSRIYNFNQYVFYGNVTGLYYLNRTVPKIKQKL